MRELFARRTVKDPGEEAGRTTLHPGARRGLAAAPATVTAKTTGLGAAAQLAASGEAASGGRSDSLIEGDDLGRAGGRGVG